jgi:hypothetical protein
MQKSGHTPLKDSRGKSHAGKLHRIHFFLDKTPFIKKYIVIIITLIRSLGNYFKNTGIKYLRERSFVSRNQNLTPRARQIYKDLKKATARQRSGGDR